MIVELKLLDKHDYDIDEKQQQTLSLLNRAIVMLVKALIICLFSYYHPKIKSR